MSSSDSMLQDNHFFFPKRGDNFKIVHKAYVILVQDAVPLNPSKLLVSLCSMLPKHLNVLCVQQLESSWEKLFTTACKLSMEWTYFQFAKYNLYMNLYLFKKVISDHAINFTCFTLVCYILYVLLTAHNWEKWKRVFLAKMKKSISDMSLPWNL